MHHNYSFLYQWRQCSSSFFALFPISFLFPTFQLSHARSQACLGSVAKSVCQWRPSGKLRVCNARTDSRGGTGRWSFRSGKPSRTERLLSSQRLFLHHGPCLLTTAAALNLAPPWLRGFGDQRHVAAQWDALGVILPRSPDGIHPETVTAAATLKLPSHLCDWLQNQC